MAFQLKQIIFVLRTFPCESIVRRQNGTTSLDHHVFTGLRAIILYTSVAVGSRVFVGSSAGRSSVRALWVASLHKQRKLSHGIQAGKT